MGVYQAVNDLEEMISGRRPLPQGTKSVKQMMIENGKWTEEDEEEEEEIDDDYEPDWDAIRKDKELGL